jgi:hypothetical protein
VFAWTGATNEAPCMPTTIRSAAAEPRSSDVELTRGGRLGQPGRRRERRHDKEPVGPRPGTEKLELDLSKVPTVEQGLADAAERDRGFIGLSKAAFGEGPDRPLFEEHLAFFSFINRATSLHRGIVSAVRDANPHVAFTLLRAYLELVVLVYYLDSNPEYIEALKRPMKELPPHTRKRFSDLFEFAGREIAGVVTTYEVLNEMAHFGSTALWHPFVFNDEEERLLAFSTAPGWRKLKDARTVLAMLQESDDAMAETLQRYSAHHVMPHVERYIGRRRILDALVGAGGTIVNEELGEFTLPADLIREGIAAGLVVYCEEHQAPELAEAITPDQVEEWLAARQGSG